MKTTQEGGGFVVTCACRWLRFEATKPGSEDAERGHAKKCKKASEPVVHKAFWGAPHERIKATNTSGLGGVGAPIPALTAHEGSG